MMIVFLFLLVLEFSLSGLDLKCLTQYNATTVKELDTQQVVVRLNNAVYTVVEVILGMTAWLKYHNGLDAMENIELTHVNALWYSMHMTLSS